MHVNHLEILFKCRFPFSRSGWDQRFCRSVPLVMPQALSSKVLRDLANVNARGGKDFRSHGGQPPHFTGEDAEERDRRAPAQTQTMRQVSLL